MSKFKNYTIIFFIIIIALLVRLYKINNPVADWHSWRQADTASVSRLYLENGIDLLRPKYHDISNIASGYENPNGWRFVEFPIFNAIHVLFYKMYPEFGVDKWGRLTSVISSLVSTFFIFLIGRKIWNSQTGLVSAFFFAALPFNIFFSRVILPEPMAVMFMVASIYFFVKYLEKNKILPIILSGLCFSLSILVKPYIVFYGLGFLYLAWCRFGVKKSLLNTHFWIFLCLSITPFLFWRGWMWNEDYLTGIPHWVWAFNGDHIRFKPAFWWWIMEERVGRMILGVWGVTLFVLGILQLSKTKYPYFLHSILLGQLCYAVLVATASVRHDYYQTLMIPAIALCVGVGSVHLWNSDIFSKTLRRLAVVGITGLTILFSFYQIREFYKINHPEIMIAGIAADKLIPKDAKIIAPYMGDTAFLYQTRRSGFPYIILPLPEMINRLGASYYVSVNYDAQTKQIMNEYKIIEQTDKYVIINLKEKK